MDKEKIERAIYKMIEKLGYDEIDHGLKWEYDEATGVVSASYFNIGGFPRRIWFRYNEN